MLPLCTVRDKMRAQVRANFTARQALIYGRNRRPGGTLLKFQRTLVRRPSRGLCVHRTAPPARSRIARLEQTGNDRTSMRFTSHVFDLLGNGTRRERCNTRFWLFLQINRGKHTIDRPIVCPLVVVWKTLHIYTHPENNPSPISFRRLTPSSRLGSLAVSDSHQITQISSLLVAFVVSLLSRQAPLSSPLQQVL